jgi:hypothetical protein
LADLELVVAEWARHEPGNLEIAAFRKAATECRSKRVSTGSRRIDRAARPGLPIEPPKLAPSSTPSRI